MSEVDEVAQEAIRAAKILRVSTPREAAELTMGRPLTDAEWNSYKAPWVRNWDLVPPPPEDNANED